MSAMTPRIPLRDRLCTWWLAGRRDGVLCTAYGGTMTGGRVRVCDKRRGHFDSHTYEFLDVLSARLEKSA